MSKPVIFVECLDLMSPRVPELWKAMQEQHQRFVSRATDDTVQCHASFLNTKTTIITYFINYIIYHHHHHDTLLIFVAAPEQCVHHVKAIHTDLSTLCQV